MNIRGVESMSSTLEIVLEQVKRLSRSEQAEVLRVLSPPPKGNIESVGDRRAKIKSFQKRFAGVLGSSEEFIAEKRREVEFEEHKWRP